MHVLFTVIASVTAIGPIILLQLCSNLSYHLFIVAQLSGQHLHYRGSVLGILLYWPSLLCAVLHRYPIEHWESPSLCLSPCFALDFPFIEGFNGQHSPPAYDAHDAAATSRHVACRRVAVRWVQMQRAVTSWLLCRETCLWRCSALLQVILIPSSPFPSSFLSPTCGAGSTDSSTQYSSCPCGCDTTWSSFWGCFVYAVCAPGWLSSHMRRKAQSSPPRRR